MCRQQEDGEYQFHSSKRDIVSAMGMHAWDRGAQRTDELDLRKKAKSLLKSQATAGMRKGGRCR